MNSSEVEQIKARLSIIDVLSSYITVQTTGTQAKAKCPFHNEKTASFSISGERGVYYCFGCGAKGDIFSFVQQFEGVDFKGALKILADRAGVVLSAQHEKADDLDPLFSAMEVATMKYEEQLQKHPEALEYLHSRGITDETIKYFRLGFAPAEWRFLAGPLSTHDQGVYERAGLIKKTEKGYYDRFRGRIMFPMSDASGRIVAFSGRLLPGVPAEENSPKYLNSPETDIFQKSRILYGFDKAKFHIKKHNFAIMVEGQMDMVLSHQAGFKNTVATSGTAVSDSITTDASAQLSVIARLTPNLFLAFDGDSAGEKALSRAALVALALGLNPKVVPLPEGTDPADYLREHSADEWKDLLKMSKHFILHKVESIRTQSRSAHELVRLMREQVLPYLARVASPIESKLYSEQIAALLGIGSEEVVRELILFKSAQPVAATPAEEQGTKPASLTPAERFVAIAARYRHEQIAAYKQSILETVFDGKKLELPELSGDALAHAISIVERDYAGVEEESMIEIARELSTKILHDFYAQLRAQYAFDLRTAEAAGDDAKADAILKNLQELNARRHSA